MLTKLGGGWETLRIGVTAQGILLDYCGCKRHWHKEGIPTDVNLHKLQQVMEIEPAITARKSGQIDK